MGLSVDGRRVKLWFALGRHWARESEAGGGQSPLGRFLQMSPRGLGPIVPLWGLPGHPGAYQMVLLHGDVWPS